MNHYIGQLLDDRYEILEVIGTGGMAIVYKALDHRLNRQVAIKILKDEFSGDDEFRRRFRAEGEAVAMLSHPNIVQVYDVSSSDDANYLVMELIDGISLKQYMEVKGVLNWKETLHFAMQIAKGLEHAHSRGIVHRDIKPHNIMVLKDGSVKVMDFGIARVMSKSNTLTKEALGSVHYISPEQAKGGYTDSRSDIYSLSVVMYEMMTGRPPFDGESPVAVAIQHINGGAPKPSSLNPNIPVGLEQIILKGMALEPKDRYSSATEMLQDMEEFRKNPAIDFQYQASGPSEHPIAIKGMASTYPKTTAERVANAKNGIPNPPRSQRPSQNTGRVNQNTGRVSQSTGRVPQQRLGVNQNTASRRPVSQNTEAMRRAALRKKEEQRKREERNRIATIAVIVCSVVAVLAIGAFLLALFNGALLNKDKDLVEVPYLVGTMYSDDLVDKYSDFKFRYQPQQSVMYSGTTPLTSPISQVTDLISVRLFSAATSSTVRITCTIIPSSCILFLSVNDYFFLENLILIACFAPFGRIYFNLSSLGTILLHPGSSLCNLIASNSHFVVQIPQPIHLFWSTTEAPHPRQRAVSAFTCSSVNTSFASRKECFVSMESLCPGIWRLELS